MPIIFVSFNIIYNFHRILIIKILRFTDGLRIKAFKLNMAKCLINMLLGVFIEIGLSLRLILVHMEFRLGLCPLVKFINAGQT
jgi:hypothetical protein